MTNRQHFDAQQIEGIRVLQLLDARLSEALMINELQDELLDFLSQEKPDRVVVDFQSVKHCSTAVINGLLRAKKRLVQDGGELKLCGMVKNVRDAYQMLNLDGTVFNIYDDVPEAIRAF